MQPAAQAALRRAWLKQEQARYQHAVTANPQQASAWRKLSQIALELGDPAGALPALDQALALQPDDYSLLLDRAVVSLHLNQPEAALAAAARALTVVPDSAEALLYQGDALLQLQRPAAALAVYQALRPAVLPLSQQQAALQSTAAALWQLDRGAEALTVLDQALALAPDHPELRLERARLRYRLRDYPAAWTEVEPLMAVPVLRFGALCLAARILAALHRFDEADTLLQGLQRDYPRSALDQEFTPNRWPDGVPADRFCKPYTGRGLSLLERFELQNQCDWTDGDTLPATVTTLIRDALQRQESAVGLEPHPLLSLPLDPALQLAVAQAQATAVLAQMAPIRQTLRIEWPTGAVQGRLRIGYVSGDFRNHATAHLIRKLFRVHDRARFEIIAYSLRSGDDSRYWHEIVAGCDRFVELFGLSNAEAATRIAADGIHLLIDLHGYTRFGRPELFALQPAPVQVSFLGYPGTLGAAYIPYLIADPVVLPENLRPCFSEQPVYLPECYQINDDEQPIADTGLTRADLDLPEDAFVYASFNNPYKIEPGIFASWLNILRQTPGSRLWLLADNLPMIRHLRQTAHQQGIDPERLVFAGRLPKPEHLERHRLADLFLDTFVVNAHTTASDALWAGLPVLTRQGATFQSQVCASLLCAVGLPELVTGTTAEYEALAVTLATNRTRLSELRQRLCVNRLIHPLFDTHRYARHLERAYELLWENYQSGRPVVTIHVPAIPR